tara:strand:+ start:1070 stop:1285 length:216 start_codon:yes stop_codon:yes gene_type:complete
MAVNKLGAYIQQLMMTILETTDDDDTFVRDLAIEELKRLKNEINSFLLDKVIEDEEAPTTKKTLLQEDKDG